MAEITLCEVLPESYGSEEWRKTTAHLMDVARKRQPDDPEGWANDWLRSHYDHGDLRALGFCRDCGQSITLRQVGCCVYSEPCGHYRAQGKLSRIRSFLDRRKQGITPQRRDALLSLIGRPMTANLP